MLADPLLVKPDTVHKSKLMTDPLNRYGAEGVCFEKGSHPILNDLTEREQGRLGS